MSRGTRLLTLAVAALTLLGVVLAPSTASAASAPGADDPYDVPDAGTVTVEGDGSGHGIGLSQYGAYRAARDGTRYRRILGHYYPGTGSGTRGGAVRVLITGDIDRALVVDDAPRLRIRIVRAGKTVRPGVARAVRWRVRPAAGRNLISYRSRGKWRAWRRVRGDVQLAAGRPLTLRTPDGPVRYRGALRSTRSARQRVTVNVLPMEQYLRGVVPAEMSASTWPQHALRAQAVAARSYAAFERENAPWKGYDLCDTAACQSYGGAAAEHGSSDRAVRATRRQVRVHDGETAFTQYSASNGGYSVAGPFDYLRAEPDPFEGTSPDFYGWTVEIPAATIEHAYDIENLTRIQVEARDGRGRRGGRVEVVRLWSETGWTGTVSGDSFRRNFGLRSTLFEVVDVS